MTSACKQEKNMFPRLQSCPKQGQLSIEETSGEGLAVRRIFWKSCLLISPKQAHELSRWKEKRREGLGEETA